MYQPGAADAIRCWPNEVIDCKESSCEAGANGGIGEKTADCGEAVAVEKFELCVSAVVETADLAAARALMARVKLVSTRTDKASSEIDEFSEEYIAVKSAAKETTHRSE